MGYKYGIYQSSPTSCILYKQDEDGNQSTFNLILFSEVEGKQEKTIISFIDNDQMKIKSWFGAKNTSVENILKVFREWASDAPIVFEFDAEKSISKCLESKFKK